MIKETQLNYPRSKNSDAKAWLGPEIYTSQETMVAPGTTALIPVGIAEIAAQIPTSELKGLRINGRSSIAQLGGDLSTRAGFAVTQALLRPEVPDEIDVPLTNHSHAPLRVRAGAVGQILNTHNAHLTGDALREAMEGKKIQVEGKEGLDWWMHLATDDVDGVNPLGIVMKLKPEKWIPNRDSHVDVPASARGTFREVLETAMQPIKDGDAAQLRIGETYATLGLQEDILGYIDPIIDPSMTPGIRSGNRGHINARFLYGGDTWPIRTEILTSPAERRKSFETLPPKAVVFTFAHVKMVE